MAPLLQTEGNYFPLTTIILCMILLIIIKHYFKFSFLRKTPGLPPGPTPWPIVGNIPHMIKGSSMPHVFLTNLAKTYGPLISLKLGTKCWIIASSPEAAMEILKTKDRILSGRYVPHAFPIPYPEINKSSIAWSECNDFWKNLRTLLRTHLFSNNAMESQAQVWEKSITQLVEFVRSKEGEVLKIADLVSATAFNLLGNALLSRDFLNLDDVMNGDGGLRGVMREYLATLAAPNLADFYQIFKNHDVQGLCKKSRDIADKIRAVWEPIIEQRRGSGSSYSGQKDYLDTLLQNGFSNDQINVQFLELFTAGTDTTSSTVEWTIAELMRNPESMEKVRAEIEDGIKEEDLDVLQLPYVQACIREALRLYPPAPLLLPHRALETTQVMNYTIPKDAQIMVNLWAIGRDPSVWEEPLKFKPERFLESNIDFKGNDFEFIPFGAGRRICPGLPMAIRTIPLILVSLIRFFDWSLPFGKDPRSELNMKEKFALSIEMEHPLELIPKPRQ
uniref:Cytochrome P450 n=1 Tax=Scoparia dulcis TaxID=107240 RepID=A0A1W7HBR5_SCODU